MKIGILTYYNVHNHGAVLQANALKTVLQNEGHDVEFIRFERNYDYIPEGNDKKYKISLASIPFYVRYLFDRGLSNILYNIKKGKILNDYRNSHFEIGIRYTDFEGDATIIGSDEVFSMEIGINPFLFGHALNTPKVFSYAGCFGPTTIDFLRRHHLENFVASGLDQMDAISVRDKNSFDIANQLCSCKDVTLVCDPVILYGYEKELKEFIPPINNYMVIYSYDRNMNSKEEISKIKQFAKDKGLKIISLGYHHKWCDKNVNATPNELLGWIKNAAYVLTDTFHGSVISIISNTSFIVKLRGNQNKLRFLLEEYGLTDRIIEDFDELLTFVSQNIDFNTVNKIVEERRQYSMNFLMKALTEND